VQAPVTIVDLVHLEGVFDVLDLYLWLSYRFMDMFPDSLLVQEMQQELDKIIQQGVFNITQLLKKSEKIKTGPMDDEEDLVTRQDQRSQRVHVHDIDTDLDLSEKPKTLANRFKMAKAVKAANMPTGRVTEELIKQGLLTPELVKKLREEWSSGIENSRNGHHTGSLRRNNPRRR
jgi:ATP-dependent RNA helicase SUPV3L1/SUV3